MSLADYIRASSPWSRRVADVVESATVLWCGTSTGAANVYTLVPTPKINDYKDGNRFMFKSHQANGGACTAQVSGRGAKAIKTRAGADPGAAVIAANSYVTLIWVQASDYFEICGLL